ncbi:MAG: hypothetical protein QM702_00135 [Rubrivivax sp.]
MAKPESGEEDDAPPERRRSRAGDEPPPQTRGLSSVFALGARVDPDAEQVDHGSAAPAPDTPRALGWTSTKPVKARKRSAKPALKAARKVREKKRRVSKAKPAAAVLAKPRRGRPPKAALAVPPTVIPPQQAPHAGIACALFNTGELLVELEGGKSLRLSRGQTAELLQWLDRTINPSTRKVVTA